MERCNAEAQSELIYKMLKKRFMWQYRKGGWPVEISYQICSQIKHIIAKERFIIEEKYKHFIPVPTASLKTRLKFLFFGKLK